MKFSATPLADAFLIELEKRGDQRGFFARFFCQDTFRNRGLESNFLQINNTLSAKAGTLRGLHYQLAPAAEVKLMRVIKGSIFDAIIDLRADSTTYKNWYGVELNDENRLMLYVPKGFAHAFLSLSDNTEVIYMTSAAHAPAQERGIRFDDPSFGIKWPIEPIEVSEKDRAWPDFNEGFHMT